MDEVERSQSDHDPKKNALRKRTPADVPEGRARDTAADEKKCCGKAEPPQSKERFGKWSKRRKIGVYNRGETKEKDEPGKVDLRLAAFDGSGHQSKGNNPERASEFDSGADNKSLRAVTRSCSYDGACVMNGKGRPQAKLRLREMEQVAQRRKDQQGHRIENKHSPEGHGHFFFICVENGSDRRDGASAADGRASRDEIRRVSPNPQKFAEGKSNNEGESDSQGGIDEPAAARPDDFVQIHTETKRHDRTLKEPARRRTALQRVRIRENQAEQNAKSERNRWREKTAETCNKDKEEENPEQSFGSAVLSFRHWREEDTGIAAEARGGFLRLKIC